MRRGFLGFVCLIVLTTGGCAVNPVTGKQELTLMSAAQEVQTGEQNYQPYQQQQGGQYVLDPELNLYVSQVGQKLAAVSDRQELPYEFVVLNNSVPNAWALPGGKIAINRGLLVLLEDEAQLAAVLGHEIVHAAARHTARQQTQATLLGVGMAAVGIAAQQTDYGQWIAAGAGLGAGAWQAKYGRDQELEADRHGVEYMHRAGYEPEAAVELQQTFVKLSEGRAASFMESLFASHPPSQERVERNRELAAKYPGGERNRSAYQQAIAQLKKDLPAYQAHQQAMAAAAKQEFDEAMSLTEKAIALQSREGLFHVLKGQILMTQEDFAEAKAAFARATQLNPEYYVGPLGSGMMAKKLGQNAEAAQMLAQSMDLLPTPIASYHLGELALTSGDREAARKYFTYAARSEGEVAQAAQAQLNKMGAEP